MTRVIENATLLAIGVLAGSWFERYTTDRSIAAKYLVVVVAIIGVRWLVVSYRNRTEAVQ
jgi:membrane protein DedA with SNARE-associated domain